MTLTCRESSTAVGTKQAVIELSITACVLSCGEPARVGTPFSSTPPGVLAKFKSAVKSDLLKVPAPSIASGQPSLSESVSLESTILSLSVSL